MASFLDNEPDTGSFLIVRLQDGKPMKNYGWPFIQKGIRCILGGAEKVDKASFLSDGGLLLKTRDKDQTDKFLQATVFVNRACNIQLSDRMNQSRGTIHAYDLTDLSEQEVVERLSEYGVVGARRITKKVGRTVENTPTLLLTFNHHTCPSKIAMDYVTYKVRKHVPKPFQCFKCGKFGHGEARCDRGETAACLNCGEDKHEGDCQAKCINCGQVGHSCKSKDCPAWEKEQEICQIKAERDISYPQARAEYEKKHRPTTAKTFADTVRTPSASPQHDGVHQKVAGLEKKVDMLLDLLGRLLERETSNRNLTSTQAAEQDDQIGETNSEQGTGDTAEICSDGATADQCAPAEGGASTASDPQTQQIRNKWKEIVGKRRKTHRDQEPNPDERDSDDSPERTLRTREVIPPGAPSNKKGPGGKRAGLQK